MTKKIGQDCDSAGREARDFVEEGPRGTVSFPGLISSICRDDVVT